MEFPVNIGICPFELILEYDEMILFSCTHIRNNRTICTKNEQTDISTWWRISVFHYFTENMDHENHFDNTTSVPLFFQNVHLRGKSKPYQI